MIKRFAAVFVGASLLAGCGGSTVIQCRIDAVRALPENEKEISINDLIQLEHELLACKPPLPSSPDSGVPK